MTPLWLDATPAVRQFVDGFADRPVREPFANQRKQLRKGRPRKERETKPLKIEPPKPTRKTRIWPAAGTVLGLEDALGMSRALRHKMRLRGIIVPKFSTAGAPKL